jgi:hypothetical protein
METSLRKCELQLQDEQRRRAVADQLKAEAFAALKSSQNFNTEQLQDAQVRWIFSVQQSRGLDLAIGLPFGCQC